LLTVLAALIVSGSALGEPMLIANVEVFNGYFSPGDL
jgi:hypothetical protein